MFVHYDHFGHFYSSQYLWDKNQVLITLFFPVLLERAHEGSLLGVGLEPAVTKLGGGVDELEVDDLQGPLLGVGQQGLAEGQHPLLGADAGALEHDEVLLHLAVVGEAAHGVNGLVRQVIVGGSIVLNQLKTTKCQYLMIQSFNV